MGMVKFMKHYLLINKHIDYIVTERNFCEHLKLFESTDSKEVIAYVANRAVLNCANLSVITLGCNSITAYSYPVWSVFQR